MKIMVNKGDFKDLIQREWIISNGIGGFAASTVTGANTRKYHGLLVAALTPPARRFLVLSKVDESIEFNGCKYPLYTNICDNYISDGYKRIESFEKKYVPTYTYKIDDISIQKTISMQYGRNTVVVLYNIKNGNYNSKLTLAPIINYRDFHQVNKDTDFNLKENITGTKVRIVVKKESQTPFYMKCSEGTYIEHHNDIFYRMFYMEEEKRGFDPIENHAIPGRYEIELKPNEEKNISFIFSLEENIDEIKAEDIIKQEEDRLKKIVEETGLVNENTEDKELIEKNNQQISMYQEEYKRRTEQLSKRAEEIEKRIQDVKDKIKECEAYKNLSEDVLSEVIFALDCGKMGILMEINPELKEYRQKIFNGENVEYDNIQM